MIDIVITSDIRIYCEGLGQILAQSRGIRVVGIANNSEAAIAAISKSSPVVALLDMTMTGSCELARHIPRIVPDTKIVALAVNYEENSIMQYAEAGVTCYVPREASVDELIEAISGAAKSECYCPPKISELLLKNLQNLRSSAKSRRESLAANEPGPMPVQTPENHTRLTRREQQITRLLAVGMSNKQIARDLSIEVSTVKNHVHNVLVKLKVKSRSQAVMFLQDGSFDTGSVSFDLDPSLNLSS